MIRIEARKNPVFTRQYHQPDEYHFCLDSILLAEFVAECLPTRLPADFRALDLCAGCGVVGLELAGLRPEIVSFDFVEVQKEFESYFEQNRALLARDEKTFRFLNTNYQALTSENAYDLIIANPPYFFEDEGRLTQSQMKNRCRFFLDSDFLNLLESCVRVLKPEGQAFLLIKEGLKHGINRPRLAQIQLGGRAKVELVADIRGTLVMKLHRSS